jgi:MFS transporter, DHA2 family, multidrug resistance protein
MFHDEKERTVAIGIWITSYSVGGAIGPLLGGVLLQFFWWGSVFLVGVPVMILLLIVAPRLLPEYKDPQAGRIDLLSVGLSLISVLSIILGLKLIAESGVHILPVISIVLGLIVGFLFIQRQKRLRDPLIDLNLFAGTSFGTLLGMNTITVLVSFGSYIFISQYLQLVLGLTPLEAGLWTLPWSVGFIAGSMLTPQISKRVKPPFIMATGLLFACAGFVVMSQVSKLELTAIVASSVLISIGLAPLFTLITDMIVGDAPPERAGAAGALSETSSEFGGALGIAIMGSIGTAIYRTQMEQAMPSAVPSHLVEASRSTLGGAITSAQTLPNDLSKALVTLSQNAFINALETLSWISAVLTVVIGLLIFLRFKGKE